MLDTAARNGAQDRIKAQTETLLGEASGDGHFCFELEADCTIPSEYVLLRHFVGEPDLAREAPIRTYLLRRQSKDGSWPLFHAGAGDISATVKAYWALKLLGEDVDAEPMAAARRWVLAEGGAASANVFTRFTLALFGEIPWRGVPTMPVEIMLLPRWFPFHMSKVSYWSRTVIAPLLVLAALKPRAVNPTGKTVRELFVTPPEEHRSYNINPTGSRVGHGFLLLDKVLRAVEPAFPKSLRRRAIDRAMEFVRERLNGEDGLGAIYPAMANASMAYFALGYRPDHPERATADGAVDRLVTVRGDETYVQPCYSPVWDTALAAHALLEADADPAQLDQALSWLDARQITKVRGDWTVRRPDAPTGGWAFQYNNDHYPDVDDTAVIIAAMHRSGELRYAQSIERAVQWLLAMQSKSGGWGAFEPENEHFYLNHIPFADHGALLDPPTTDVTARCVSALAQLDDERLTDAVERGVAFILREQEPDGSWFGRWGANYVYGTWSALCALNAAGVDPERPEVQKAVDWLRTMQREDGGWGEGLETYEPNRRGYAINSTPSQTAWALMGLMAAGAVDDPATERGMAYLTSAPLDGARWAEDLYTGTGFPRVFYLKYHGYAAYFPLWAMARYERLMRGNDRTVSWGL
ncbi:MAG: squalene--hopene cyclase [Pseudomonadota bacterium]